MPIMFNELAALLGEDPEMSELNQANPLETGEQHPEMPQYQYKYGNTDVPREAMLQKLQEQALAKADPRIEKLRSQGMAGEEEDSGFHPGKLMLNILQFSPKLGGFARGKLNEIEGRKGTAMAARKQALDEAYRLEESGLKSRDALRSDLGANRDEEKYQSELKAEGDPNDLNDPQAQYKRALMQKLGLSPEMQELLPKFRNKQLDAALKDTLPVSNYEASRAESAARLAETQTQNRIGQANVDRSFNEQTRPLKTAEDKKRYDLAIQNLKAIKDMKGALQGGANTFSLVGDNPYTEARRRAAEYFGRLQSGGAISKPEEERFLEMSPGVTDKSDIQSLKLTKAAENAYSVLNTLGIPQEEVENILSSQEMSKTEDNKRSLTPEQQKRLDELRRKAASK